MPYFGGNSSPIKEMSLDQNKSCQRSGKGLLEVYLRVATVMTDCRQIL